MMEQAEIVIIGGGAVGCGVAYSLAQAGKRDILLLEKEPSLAAVTTAQAAGLVGQVRSSVDRVRLAMWSVKTFGELQQDQEANPNWRQVGSLRLAESDARVEEFQRLKATCDKAGLEVALIDAAEAARLWPGMTFGAAKVILWCPSDGYLQPADLAMAYQRHARRMGVRFKTGTPVTAIDLQNGRVSGVRTAEGAIACETVINAAGAHGWHIAQLVGIELPIVPVRHEYFITVPGDGIAPAHPCFRVPDSTLYGRPDVNAFLLGGWEPEALSCDPRDYPLAGEPPPIEEDWPVLSNFAELMAPFFPPVGELGVRHVFSGWPTFTPDGRFIVGESRKVPGFVCAVGCNAHGVSGSAGIGQHVVEAMLEAKPSDYVASLSPNRFTETSWDWGEARRKAQGVYETYYAVGH